MIESPTDQEIRNKAVELGLIGSPNDPMPHRYRGRIVAAILQGQAPRPAPQQAPRMAGEIVVQPKGPILVDGEPFPWLVTDEPMDIRLAADGSGTVRLTLAAQAVQIIKPEETREDQS